MSGAIFKVVVGAMALAMILLSAGIYLSERYTAEHQQLAATGDTAEAMEQLRFAARLNPFNPEPLVYEAGLYRQQGEADAALQALSAAIERDPHNYSRYTTRAELYAGDLNEPLLALEDYKQAQQLNPNAVSTRYQMASMYLRLDEPNAAREVYEQLRNMEQLSRDGRYDLGRIYVLTGDPEQGRRNLDQARIEAEAELEQVRESPDQTSAQEEEELEQFVLAVDLAIADSLVVEERYEAAREIIVESEAEQAPAILQLLDSGPEEYRQAVLDSALL